MFNLLDFSYLQIKQQLKYRMDYVSGLHNFLEFRLPTPLVFISGYASTENVFYCLNVAFSSFREVSSSVF